VELQVDPLLESQRLNVLNIARPRAESEAVEGVLDLLIVRDGLAEQGGCFVLFSA
jgi:hypothetical protein